MSNIAVEEKEEITIEEENVKEDYKENLNVYKLRFGQKIYIFVRSLLERILALLAIIILMPVLLILAVAVKCSSKGPVFFKQERIGKKRKIFKCYKFRSMTQDAPHYESDKTFKAENCITKVGRFMRKTSLDELGQLFNVLSGKMSIIGYRPLIANEKEMDFMRMKKGVYQIKPGITGWAQVNGRTQITDEQKANYDEWYLKHVSPWLDIKIIFMTVKQVVCSNDVKTNSSDESDSKKGEEL